MQSFEQASISLSNGQRQCGILRWRLLQCCTKSHCIESHLPRLLLSQRLWNGQWLPAHFSSTFSLLFFWQEAFSGKEKNEMTQWALRTSKCQLGFVCFLFPRSEWSYCKCQTEENRPLPKQFSVRFSIFKISTEFRSFRPNGFLFLFYLCVSDFLLGVIFVCLTVCPTLGPCCIEACGPGVSVQAASHDGHKILYFTNGPTPRIKRLISMYNQSSLSWFCRLMNQSRPVCQPRMDPCKTRDPLHPTPKHHSFLISIYHSF